MRKINNNIKFVNDGDINNPNNINSISANINIDFLSTNLQVNVPMIKPAKNELITVNINISVSRSIL